MSIGGWLSLFLLAAAAPAAATGKAASAAPAAAAAEAGAAPEIVVTGRRLPVLGGGQPLFELDERAVAGFGAGTIAELLEFLAAETRSAGGGGPVILVNGRRIASFAEVRNLPPEALARIEVYPEETALRYGYRPDQRVVNLVLRPGFRAVTVEADRGFATEGGVDSYRAEASIARIAGEGRWNVSARYVRDEGLLESERKIVEGRGIFRSLLPRRERATLSGSITRDVFEGVAATLTVQADAGETESRVGSSLPPGEAARPLYRRADSKGINLGVSLSGEERQWTWTFTGSLDRSRTDTVTQRPAASGVVEEFGRSDLRFAEAQLLLSGPLLSLPAGEVQTSISIETGFHSLRTFSTIADQPEGMYRARSRSLGKLVLHVPLTGGGWLDGLGDLAANLEGGAEHVSGFGTLGRIGAGLRWRPVRPLTVTAFHSREEQAPLLDDLAGPLLRTPNVLLFDFVAGRAAEVERLDGGNPLLRAEERRVSRLEFAYRPSPRHDAVLTAGFVRHRLINPVGALPSPSRSIEAAFPDRFLRDPAGRLVRYDARPVNFARLERDQVHWGLHWSKAFAVSAAARELEAELGGIARDRDRGGRVHFSLQHRTRLRERLVLRAGAPAVDFLAGEVPGPPRHEIEAEAGFFRDGIGARLEADWQSGRRVRHSAPADLEPRSLSYSARLRINFRAFVDLGKRPEIARRAPWTRDMRVAVAVDNLFNQRTSVRDQTGSTPAGLQSAYLEPAGRTVSLSLRKLF